MKIRLDFCDFWPGFPKTNNFFFNLLKERFDVEICDKPDYVIFSDLGSHVHRLYNCVKIYFCPEDFPPDFQQYDYALTARYVDDPRHIRFPYYVLGNDALTLIKDGEDDAVLLKEKTKFCSFMVSYGNRKTSERVKFFHRLSKYKQVDSGGRVLNNIGRSIAPGVPSKLEFLRQYKFHIAFENASMPGYTTEKLVHAMRARTLPIYWGNPRVSEEFNSHSFLSYFDFPNEEALIEKIIELDKDDGKYLEYLRQPYFHSNVPNEFFSHERLLDFFEKVFTQRIRPVSQKRSFFRLGRWMVVKKNQSHYQNNH